jgi:hypothetical protein
MQPTLQRNAVIVGKAVPNTVQVLEKLRMNCHLGKHKHFEASTRGRQQHVMVGLPIVAINLILGSTFFVQVENTIPVWTVWIGAVLALGAAMLAGVQTFFNFRKEYEAHRQTGNEYLHLARECERLIALFLDGQMTLRQVSASIKDLNVRYRDITKMAEHINVRPSDYRRALQTMDEKRADEPTLVDLALAVANAGEASLDDAETSKEV